MKGKERLRPTSSKVREAIFDILRSKVNNASFVDLYAGTGTVGLEALSRGALKAVFVEPDEYLAEEIRKVVEKLGLHEKAAVVKCRADQFLKKSLNEGESFDIFFIDPPYHSNETEKIMPVMGTKGVVDENGIVVVEHFFKKEMPETEGNLKKEKSYRYGDTMLTFYKRIDE
jgi:16S rRNA (guanine(966)-N(2))-methyltransferase RsmD